MTYDQARDQEQLGRLDAAVSLFINRFKANPSDPEHRQTIILFPGGLGSRLLRAEAPFEDGVPRQVFNYDTVWLDCSVLGGAALNLQLQNNIDTESKFILADGAIDFPLLNLRPYDDFVQWCTNRNLDLFVYGWDWRRSLDHIVSFFLTGFLPTFRQRVQDACGVDPLKNCTLIGHSFGGMVVKLIMNDPNPVVDQLTRAVTVGSPFYGYAGQVHRYFQGEQELDFEGKGRITRVVSSMPGSYVLMFLDKDTYDRDKVALANDPDYPLAAYPSVDATNNAVIADPYNPQTKGQKVRYPKNFGFMPSELAIGKGVYQQVASPLSVARNQKFLNVRGVQFKSGAVVNETVNSVTWDWISKNFNPDTNTTPIVDDASCPGDGVIPAWSARLASALPANVRTLVGDLDHMTMMNSEQVQSELAGILELPEMMVVRRAKRKAPSKKRAAGRRETSKFIAGLKALHSRQQFDNELDREQAIRRYLAKHNLLELQQFMRRAFIDALKTPGQKRGEIPEKTAAPSPDGYPTKGRSSSKARGKSRKR